MLHPTKAHKVLFIIQVLVWFTCCCFYLCDITSSSSSILKGTGKVLQEDFCRETPIASEFVFFPQIRNSILVQALPAYLCGICPALNLIFHLTFFHC